MAKKRGGGGSNMGLIITLIFFVLATCVLGVTTWLGFSGQDELAKAKNKEKNEKDKMTKERDWYRFQSRAYRAYMGYPARGKDDKETTSIGESLTLYKGQFDKNQLAAAQGQDDVADFTEFVKSISNEMPWDTDKKQAVPARTFKSRLEEENTRNQQLAQANAQLIKEKTDLIAQEKDARERMEEEKKIFDKKLAKLDVKAKDDLKDAYDQLNKSLAKETEMSKEKTGLLEAKDTVDKALDKEKTKLKKLEGKLTQESVEKRQLKEDLDAERGKVAALVERTGVSASAVEAERLNAAAREVLRRWDRNWRVVEINRNGSQPYINLGSADGLQPQVTFSVHSPEAGGKLNPTPKATIEVVRVIGPHLSQARVTSLRDPRADPLLKGDRLFNPTWDPGRKKRVALAGIADLGSEHAYTNEDFFRLMRRQSVAVDAHIDTRDDKSPQLKGAVTINTDYLILGEGLEATGHPQARDNKYKQQYEEDVKRLVRQAKESGVTIISVNRYLDMIGYRPPRAATPTR